METKLIEPHGGTLINRVAADEEIGPLLELSREMKRVRLSPRALSDLGLIAVGAYSPLKGFMTRETYLGVAHGKRLPGGLPWTLPITLAVESEETAYLKEGERVALLSPAGDPVGILHLEEKFSRDKREEARLVYGTEDEVHPGVSHLYAEGDILLGGDVTLLREMSLPGFEGYHLTPAQVRAVIRGRGWASVAAFQTRNPIHRAHEYIQKCVLEFVDGLLIHPLVGETKRDDVPADLRMRCYETLLKEYYPAERVILSVFPGAMRYAGPREAVFHALVRKNYGCTHFIVGRDHAGVGSYYGPTDAQKIFNEFGREELRITPISFDNSFYCTRCESMASPRTCPHGPAHRLSLSGTKVREMIKSREALPKEFTRPEVARLLSSWAGEERYLDILKLNKEA